MEPILSEDNCEFFHSQKREDLHVYYKIQQSSMWKMEDIDFSQDVVEWKKELKKEERFFLKQIFIFFAIGDGIVNLNLSEICQKVQYIEARNFYAFQMAIETVHNETYRMIIDLFVPDDEERDSILQFAQNHPIIAKKTAWALKWLDKNNTSFPKRLIAFIAVEGIFFSGSFCAIFWLKKRGKLPGLTQSNEYISRDETLHCDFAINLYNNHIVNKIPKEEITAILTEALDIERDFVQSILPSPILDMNASKMNQYLEYLTDRLLKQLNCPTVFNVTCPFDFMNIMSLSGKTSFFERRVSEYSV